MQSQRHKGEPFPELLTVKELAALLRISHRGEYRLVEKRRIPFHRVLRTLRFSSDDVLVYLGKNRVEAITND